jgi:hypothetical protein
MQGFICSPRIYKYAGWQFEYHDHSGAWPLDADGEPLAQAGQAFWNMIRRFYALPKAERETYRVGGGCVELQA